MLTIAVASLFFIAQTSDASVSGTVRSVESGAPLRGATISISGAARENITAADGRFVVTSVRNGLQRMTVRCIGHAARTIDVFVPRQGNISIDVALDPMAIRLAPVSVVERRRYVRARDASRDSPGERSVTTESLAHHSMLAEPDMLRAVSGGDVFVQPETAGGLFVRGGRSDQVAYSVDGIPVFNVVHLAGLLGAWNTDALSGARLVANSSDLTATSALSGSLTATTLTPNDSVSLRAALSSTQLRLMAAGPIPGTNAGYLISMRQAVPTLHADADPNLLRGESGDWLGKLSMPIASGTLALLMHGSGDEFTSSQVVSPMHAGAARNAFQWESRSVGASWMRAFAHSDVRVTAWQATARASSEWNTQSSGAQLDSRRTDYGAQIVRRPAPDRDGTTLAARVEMVRTAYGVRGIDSAGPIGVRLDATAPIATLTASRTFALSRTARAALGTALSASHAGRALVPHARLEWWPSSRLSVSADASRTVQHVQSLRNTESVVSHTFPAELYVMASHGQIPIARSDQASITADLHSVSGMSFSGVADTRAMQGLLMAAERESGPFAVASGNVTSATTGRAQATGASVNLRYTSDKVTALLMYSVQHVRYRVASAEFAPEFSAPHRLDAGVTIEAARGFTLRVGGTAAYGRRATAALGAVEWDGCNLADRACEFAGAPASSPDALGALSLPGYARVDVGVRKQWHRMVRDRDNPITVYGTVTNLFNRTNYLTRTDRDGILAGVEMRSRSPLVVGVEWKF